MKFSGPVQLLASNFWAGESDEPAQRLRPWAYLLPEFLSYWGVTYLFGPGLKSLGSGILNFGVGPEILDPEQAGTHPKNIFLEFGIFT